MYLYTTLFFIIRINCSKHADETVLCSHCPCLVCPNWGSINMWARRHTLQNKTVDQNFIPSPPTHPPFAHVWIWPKFFSAVATAPTTSWPSSSSSFRIISASGLDSERKEDLRDQDRFLASVWGQQPEGKDFKRKGRKITLVKQFSCIALLSQCNYTTQERTTTCLCGSHPGESSPPPPPPPPPSTAGRGGRASPERRRWWVYILSVRQNQCVYCTSRIESLGEKPSEFFLLRLLFFLLL